MRFNGKHGLPRNGAVHIDVISGTFVPMICRDGYVNVGGQLNITCVDRSWTPFPNCVLYRHDGAEVMTLNNGASCSIDSTSFLVENGFMTATSEPQLPMEFTYSGI